MKTLVIGLSFGHTGSYYTDDNESRRTDDIGKARKFNTPADLATVATGLGLGSIVVDTLPDGSEQVRTVGFSIVEVPDEDMRLVESRAQFLWNHRGCASEREAAQTARIIDAHRRAALAPTFPSPAPVL